MYYRRMIKAKFEAGTEVNGEKIFIIINIIWVNISK
jgi:hypothetical protein